MNSARRRRCARSRCTASEASSGGATFKTGSVSRRWSTRCDGVNRIVLEALVLSIGLAMDATAVAAARSVSGVRRRSLLLLAAAFGIAQAAMAGAGWFLGSSAERFISRWDHWIAFGLLLVIGGKMLVEAFRDDEADADAATAVSLGVRTVVILAIATSIDALAAGVTLPALEAPPTLSLALIGVATFVLSSVGGFLGARLGRHLGRKLEIAGGLALIGIGIKTLVDHLAA